jgi:hypothetical protein
MYWHEVADIIIVETAMKNGAVLVSGAATYAKSFRNSVETPLQNF